MKIGIGYDIHRLEDERRLFLGGVEIPYVKGLMGYSDGDVILHAISDAILGALGRGDIGEHFPNTDPAYKDIASSKIVEEVRKMVDDSKMYIHNIDVTVIAEEPKIHPFREKMVEAISDMLGIGRTQVNIKATTNECVGAIGRGEAIASYAVVTLDERV